MSAVLKIEDYQHQSSSMPEPKMVERFFGLARDMFCIASQEGYLTWVSPRFSQNLGWDTQTLLQRPFMSFVHPEDVQRTQLEFMKIKSGESAILFENRYLTNQGDYHWLQWNAEPDGEGNFFCVVRDITSVKQSERDQNSHSQWLEMMSNMAEVGYWRVDLEKQKIHWSEMVFKIHGVDPSEGEPPLEDAINFYHPNDRDTVRQALDVAIQNKGAFNFTLRLVRSDGSTRWVRSRGQCETGHDGEVISIFGVFTDVTDMRENQLATERRNEELEQFAHLASHDLQEPLRMISSYVDLIDRQYVDHSDARAKRFMNYVQEGAHRMKTLIDDLLIFASTGGEVHTEKVDLAKLVASIVSDYEVRIRESRATISASGLGTVHSDPLLLRQILQNLISNALKFAGDEPARIEISVDNTQGACKLSVKDYGIGIEEHQQRAIFKPFFRLHNRETYPGNGIGLSMVRKAVEKLSGTLTLDSKPGHGTTFHVTLP